MSGLLVATSLEFEADWQGNKEEQAGSCNFQHWLSHLQATDMREVLARALRALAVSPLNCSLILDAGGLDQLTDMLCGRDQELAHQALVVLSLLTKVSCIASSVLTGSANHVLLQSFSHR